MSGRAGPVLAAVAAVIVVLLAAGSPRDESGRPLDPASTGPQGARAMVLLAESLGAEVDVVRAVPDADEVDVVVLLQDRLGGDEADQLVAFVSAGGRLVVADPFSRVSPAIAGPAATLGLFEGSLDRGRCEVAALAAVDAVAPGPGVLYELEGGDRSCFGDDERAFVVVTDVGAGTVAAVGGGDPFTNEGIDEEDNAVLVGSLVAPRPGTRVAVVDAVTFPGAEGTESVRDLVPDRVVDALWQVAIAFVVYAFVRGRRFGRVVSEPQPTLLAGSDLVDAVGDLMAQRRDPAPAGHLLRQGLRQDLKSSFGLPADAAPPLVADAVIDRLDLDEADVRRAVHGPPVTDDEELVRLAQDIHRIREELHHERAR